MGLARSYRREEGDAQLSVSLLPGSISIEQPLPAPWRWSKDLRPSPSEQQRCKTLGTYWSSVNFAGWADDVWYPIPMLQHSLICPNPSGCGTAGCLDRISGQHPLVYLPWVLHEDAYSLLDLPLVTECTRARIWAVNQSKCRTEGHSADMENITGPLGFPEEDMTVGHHGWVQRWLGRPWCTLLVANHLLTALWRQESALDTWRDAYVYQRQGTWQRACLAGHTGHLSQRVVPTLCLKSICGRGPKAGLWSQNHLTLHDLSSLFYSSHCHTISCVLKKKKPNKPEKNMLNHFWFKPLIKSLVL